MASKSLTNLGQFEVPNGLQNLNLSEDSGCCVQTCAYESLFVWERDRKDKTKRDRRDFEESMAWTYTVYIHVFLRIGITYIRHKRL